MKSEKTLILPSLNYGINVSFHSEAPETKTISLVGCFLNSAFTSSNAEVMHEKKLLQLFLLHAHTSTYTLCLSLPNCLHHFQKINESK